MRTVDVALDTDIWVGLPGEWGVRTWPDHRVWAREVADTVWSGVDPQPGQGGPDHLALALAMLAEDPAAEDPARRSFFWLPGPMTMPLPVHLTAFVAEGDRDESLRELTGADVPGAVAEPVVETFRSEHLGAGLRVLRYAADPEDDAIIFTLRYAWRAADLDVLLWLSTFDSGLALRAMDDVDGLARAIHLVEV